MDDLISRQAAIDALYDEYHGMISDKTMHIYEIVKWLDALPSAQPDASNTNAGDVISRQAALNEISKQQTYKMFEGEDTVYFDANDIGSVLASLPSAQPEPLSEAYSKAVLTWLLDYQIKAAELNGKYSPYEVLSWVVNDWRKENG